MKTAKIIGCGLSGITSAILLKEKGYNIEIFDKRDHIGGNCFDQKINICKKWCTHKWVIIFRCP